MIYKRSTLDGWSLFFYSKLKGVMRMSGRGRKSLSELRADVEKGEQRKKYYENEIRIKERQIKHLTRAERTHRLCSHGGMLEKFIERPDILSEEQIMKLLTYVFHKSDVQTMLQEMINEAEMQERE